MAVSLLLAFLAAALLVSCAQTADYLGAPCIGDVCDNGMECLSLDGGNCTWDGFNMDSPCSCGGAGGESDPYFTGFSGQSFYFRAEAGNVYNVYSEQTHFVNAYFVSTELPRESDLLGLVTGAQNSSFIETVALQHGQTEVDVSSDRSGAVAVRINGEVLSLGEMTTDMQARLSFADSVSVSIMKYPMPFGTSVTLETDLLSVIIFPEEQHVDNMGNTVRGHLSLQMSLKVCKHAAPPSHGILGQTIDPQVTSLVQDAFPGKGDAADYVVSSLYATDFKYSMYGKASSSQAVEPQLPSSAIHTSRKLMEGGSVQELDQELPQASFGTHFSASRQH